MTLKTLNLLQNVVEDAISYVGMANYSERESWALKEVRRCFLAAFRGSVKNIVFRGPKLWETK